MKSLVVCLVVLAVSAMAGTIPAQEFYFGSDGPISMLRDSSKVLLKFDPYIPVLYQEAILDSIGRITGTISSSEPVDQFIVCSLATGSGYEQFLDSVKAIPAVLFAEPFYVLEDGGGLYIGQSFCAAFDSQVTSEVVDSINALYSVSVQRELQDMPNVFLLLNSPNSGYRTLELANQYHNLPETRYAHPNFGIRAVEMSYKLFDYYHGYQPHTKKIIGTFNAASVWDFAGLQRSITVAVIDDGVDAHEDLPGSRILQGYDFADNESDTRPGPTRSHGIACAGIIGSSHTTDSLAGLQSSSGVFSLDPLVEILPVNIFGDSGNAASNDAIAEAITYAYTHGADILSNSWGYGHRTFDYPAITEALEKATVFGRNGLGCPVVFSSGNTDSFNPDPSYVRYPARLPFCFAVGATQMDDYRWDYSCYGTELDMVGPSDDGETVPVWALDQMAALGWNPTYMSDCPPGSNDVDYDCHFGGTSAACPLVSGTAALIMSRDSTLNFQGYYYILEYSAVKDLDWGTLPDTPHVQYGYGRVDAFRAVLSISHGNIDNSADCLIDLSDLVYLVDYMFTEGPPPFPSVRIADLNCSGGVIDIDDLNYLAEYMFAGGPPPVSPCFEFE